MEYEIRNYSSYDDDPRFVVRSDTGNISNISDRMVRLAAKITEIYAGDGYFVRGQRNTDYNWSLLAEFDNMDSAKEYIKSIRTDPVQQLVYGPDGYGIRI